MMEGWQGRNGQGACVSHVEFWMREGTKGQGFSFLTATQGVAPVDERGWALLAIWMADWKVTQVGTEMR